MNSGRDRRIVREAVVPFLSMAFLACGVSPAGEAETAADERSAHPLADYDQWYAYGGDAGGKRFSPLRHLTPANVGELENAWTYRTGELAEGSPVADKLTFEATPIFFADRLYLSTAFGEIIALDAATGTEVWRYEPDVRRGTSYSELVSRGVSLWIDSRAAADAACRARILEGTIDARLIAVDAETGRPCDEFGDGGEVDLAAGYRAPRSNPGDYQVTSPPAIVGDVVVVGSSIGDNWHTDTGGGAVRGFDARSGELLWAWDPLTRDTDQIGAANAWSIISADPGRDLVFVPTGSPSPDFFGGARAGDNEHANSVVALRGSTGELAWSFQTVHHDLWDYDVAAQPALVTVSRDGRAVPAVAQATKMGNLFLLHRETGEPLFPVEERPVPQSDVPGESTSPVQPFPSVPRSLMPQAALQPEDAWGRNDTDRQECRELIARHDNDGIFTPPSLEGTIMYPGNGSGTNWGSVAYDPDRDWLLVSTSRFATLVRLVPREELDEEAARVEAGGEDYEIAEQRGVPYGMMRRTLLSSSGYLCNPPPWGTLAAVDLSTGEVRWEVPVGQRGGRTIGLANAGGPIVTAGGLVFLAATMDDRIRAFDLETGEVLWSAELPLSGMATPMTYAVDGRQYVVIAAGGHGKMGMPTGDYVVAFALP